MWINLQGPSSLEKAVFSLSWVRFKELKVQNLSFNSKFSSTNFKKNDLTKLNYIENTKTSRQSEDSSHALPDQDLRCLQIQVFLFLVLKGLMVALKKNVI